MAEASIVGLPRTLALKWAAFQLLERLSDLKGNTAAGHFEVDPAAQARPSLWVFVSTIGELNAIHPLLQRLKQRLATHQLVLITDHPHYRSAYQARHPEAAVCVTRGHSSDARALARQYPPELLVVAEIPCLPSDAPCRFSMAFVVEAKRRRAAAAIVNGWLYHYDPPSRMDRVERRWLGADYLRAFDAVCVQTEEVRRELMASGADAGRLHVTGNIKFDALPTAEWTADQARSPVLLKSLLASGRPIVVAGCVTELPEQEMVLDAFGALRAELPGALLVLGPRHPEVQERMAALRQFLQQRQVASRFRSEMADAPLPAEAACLVLDTMGELRDFYAAAAVAHVGVDHNVLEPLGFGKQVTVLPGWESTYPSYPVYRMLHDEDALLEVRDAGELAEHWLQAIEGPTDETNPLTARSRSVVDRAKGATERHLAILATVLNGMRGSKVR